MALATCALFGFGVGAVIGIVWGRLLDRHATRSALLGPDGPPRAGADFWEPPRPVDRPQRKRGPADARAHPA